MAAVTGTVTVREGEVEAALEIEDGAVNFAGVDATEILGPVRFENGAVLADLRGRTLGGPIQAEGSVDIGARRWQTEVRAQPSLQSALDRLLGENAPPATGEATVTATLSGWREVTASGRMVAEGEIAGRALEVSETTFAFRDGQPTLQGNARYGGAPVTVTVRPGEAGSALNLQATGLPLTGGLSSNLQADLTGRPDDLRSLQGTVDLLLWGELQGEPLSLMLNGGVEGGTFRLSLPEGDALGGTLSGGLTLTEEGVQGEVTAQGLGVPGISDPVGLTLRADGTLETLPFTLEVSADGPLGLVSNGVTLGTDLRGDVSGVLIGTRLRGLEGRLGALSFEGTLGADGGELAYTLAETPVQGSVRGTVALQNGSLILSAEGLRTAALLTTSPIETPGAELPALQAQVTGELDGGLSLSLNDEGNGVRLTLNEDELASSFVGTRLELLGIPVTLDGETTFTLAAPLDTLTGTLTVRAPQGEARLGGAGDTLSVDIVTEAGAPFGLVTLERAANLSGTFTPEDRTLTLKGALGEVGVEVGARLGEALSGEAILSTSGESVTFEVSGTPTAPFWEARGTFTLETLGAALGVPLTGRLETSLSRTDAGYAGEAGLEGRFGGVPLDLGLSGQGAALVATAQTDIGGFPLRLEGPVFPEAAATVSLGDVGYGAAHRATGGASAHRRGRDTRPRPRGFHRARATLARVGRCERGRGAARGRGLRHRSLVGAVARGRWQATLHNRLSFAPSALRL